MPFLRSVRAQNAFVQILGEVRDRYGFSLVGYVVMPEHIHLLIRRVAQPLNDFELRVPQSSVFEGWGF